MPHLSWVALRTRRRPSIALTGVVFAALSLALPDRAATADPLAVGGDTVGVQADDLDVDVAAGDAVLTGNVSLTKGDLKVSCPRLEVRFDTTPHVKWAKGSGGVVADVHGVHAEAPDVELDLEKRILDLRGGVRLTRGHGWLQADHATIDIGSAKVTLSQVRGSIPRSCETVSAKPASESVALRARGLEVVRGDRTLLRDISLDVQIGEIVGILGPSGAGKSTLFGALMGDPPAENGTVFLGDREISGWPMWRRARQGLGYMPQAPSVLWDLTTRENLATFHVVAGVAYKSTDDLDAIAAKVGLVDRMTVRAGSLSAGERRRLELARAACIKKPNVLLCDEPFAGVDPVGAARLAALLATLASEGVAVIFADHHVEESLALCHRAILLLAGEIALEEAPSAFRANPLVRARYLGSATAAG